MLTYYSALFTISVVLTIVYALMWHKHFDVHLTIIYILVPIANLAYCFIARAKDLTEALAAQKIVYIGATFMIVFMTFSIFSLCKIRLPRWFKGLLITASFIVYSSILTIGSGDHYYIRSSLAIDRSTGVSVIQREYGFMHTVFYVYVAICFAMCLFALLYSFVNKRNVSNFIVMLLFLPVLVASIAFFLGHAITKNIELAPVSYVYAQLVFLLIAFKLGLYDVNDSGIDSLVQKGETAFISFDFKMRYLGCNETALKFFPKVSELIVDKPIYGNQYMNETAVKWLEAFKEDEENNEFHYSNGDSHYKVIINYLFDGRRKRGVIGHGSQGTKSGKKT